MLEHELVLRLAMRAFDGLNDSSTFDEAFFLMVAALAEESSLLHFGDDVTIADDDAAQSDHLVDVLGTELTDAVGFEQVVGTHLDEDIFLLFAINHVLFAA